MGYCHSFCRKSGEEVVRERRMLDEVGVELEGG